MELGDFRLSKRLFCHCVVRAEKAISLGHRGTLRKDSLPASELWEGFL